MPFGMVVSAVTLGKSLVSISVNLFNCENLLNSLGM